MSWEDDYDSGREEYEADIAAQAIEDFQSEPLQSFYRDHTDLALQPIQMAKEARLVLEQSPSPCSQWHRSKSG